MPAAIIKSFARQSGETPAAVERLWKRAGAIVQKQYGAKEPETGERSGKQAEKHYKLRVGVLKKMLGIDKTPARESVEETLRRCGLGDLAIDEEA